MPIATVHAGLFVSLRPGQRPAKLTSASRAALAKALRGPVTQALLQPGDGGIVGLDRLIPVQDLADPRAVITLNALLDEAAHAQGLADAALSLRPVTRTQWPVDPEPPGSALHVLPLCIWGDTQTLRHTPQRYIEPPSNQAGTSGLPLVKHPGRRVVEAVGQAFQVVADADSSVYAPLSTALLLLPEVLNDSGQPQECDCDYHQSLDLILQAIAHQKAGAAPSLHVLVPGPCRGRTLWTPDPSSPSPDPCHVPVFVHETAAWVGFLPFPLWAHVLGQGVAGEDLSNAYESWVTAYHDLVDDLEEESVPTHLVRGHADMLDPSPLTAWPALHHASRAGPLPEVLIEDLLPEGDEARELPGGPAPLRAEFALGVQVHTCTLSPACILLSVIGPGNTPLRLVCLYPMRPGPVAEAYAESIAACYGARIEWVHMPQWPVCPSCRTIHMPGAPDAETMPFAPGPASPQRH